MKVFTSEGFDATVNLDSVCPYRTRLVIYDDFEDHSFATSLSDEDVYSLHALLEKAIRCIESKVV
jgi:hypothetical protein